jgi:hypothetical protein
MYSVIVFKATRTPQLYVANLAKEAAIAKAGEVYELSKFFADKNLLVSGVAVIVMEDEKAMQAVEAGALPHSSVADRFVFQCGGF